MPLVTSQPFAVNAPIAAVFEQSNEKGCAHEEYGRQYAHLHDTESRHCRCKSRRRRIVLSIALVFFIAMFLVGVVGLWDATFNDSSLLKGTLGLTADGSENSWTVLGDLMKRQSDGTTGSSSTFVSHKYYLIIVFVGLVLVVLAAICLSAWCCRGVFENPLCCPCYVCACCGGLACLECIGCGLCAEGIDQM
ncbi:hypothetical protein V8D89_000786 [Ganoderma adspersum]